MSDQVTVEVWPDLVVGFQLPCGCLESTKPGIESQLVTCVHDREWVVSTGEPRTVVSVFIETVPEVLRSGGKINPLQAAIDLATETLRKKRERDS